MYSLAAQLDPQFSRHSTNHALQRHGCAKAVNARLPSVGITRTRQKVRRLWRAEQKRASAPGSVCDWSANSARNTLSSSADTEHAEGLLGRQHIDHSIATSLLVLLVPKILPRSRLPVFVIRVSLPDHNLPRFLVFSSTFRPSLGSPQLPSDTQSLRWPHAIRLSSWRPSSASSVPSRGDLLVSSCRPTSSSSLPLPRLSVFALRRTDKATDG